MKLKLYEKNILSVFAILAGGFVLFNLAFILAAFIINAVILITGGDRGMAPQMPARLLALLVIFLISWFVLRSKLNDLIKATFMTMPLMVILVMVGLVFYNQPKWVIFGSGALIISAVLFYLFKKKLSWMYYFSTFYVTVLALCIMLFNVEI